MRSDQTQVLRSFRRVRQFIAGHTPANAPASFGRQLAELDDVLARLDKAGLDQEAGARSTRAETRRQEQLRATLWKSRMLPVSRVARELFAATGVNAALKMPRKSIKNEDLINSARAMAEAAEKEKGRLAEHGLPADCALRLRAAADALAVALAVRVETARRKVKATAAADEQIKRGKRAVRVLDAVITLALEGNAEELAAWTNARKVWARPVASEVVEVPAVPVRAA